MLNRSTMPSCPVISPLPLLPHNRLFRYWGAKNILHPQPLNKSLICFLFMSYIFARFRTRKEGVPLLDSLITSKTRIKLLMKFFLNPGTSAYLRSLADEFGESTNSVRVELNRLSEAGLLESADEGRTKVYRANEKHPLFPEVQRIVAKTVGLDKVVEQVVSRLGNVELAFVTGDYARGVDSGLIDLVIVGEINTAYYQNLAPRLEKVIGRKIRGLILSKSEFEKLNSRFNSDSILLVWAHGNPQGYFHNILSR